MTMMMVVVMTMMMMAVVMTMMMVVVMTDGGGDTFQDTIGTGGPAHVVLAHTNNVFDGRRNN
jgi:hypothetical protein